MQAAREITRHDVAALLPHPALLSNKYSRGCLVIVAGSSQYPGAAILASSAAPRCGAGYTRLMTPAGAADAARCHLISVPVTACPEVDGAFDPASFQAVEAAMVKGNALLLGPGLGMSEAAKDFVWALLESGVLAGKPLCLDADALNIVAGDTERFIACRDGRGATVLTPHEGEAARLLGRKVVCREDDALTLAKALDAIVVLKGSHTLIASPDGSLSECACAGPELAKAGSGDVLAGMLGAFLAQGMQTMDAARLAVYLHAMAGRLAADAFTDIAVMPEDLIDFIGPALLILDNDASAEA